MSELSYFLTAPRETQKEYASVLDKTAVAMGRTNSPDDRVDWEAVNEKMIEWWAGKGYRFP
jgi:hypothetical protein